ncbi:MAG: hypothetical protein FWD61_19360 [Phycisphaerales bacterium]|nr:hypothetical protein [Phycisphaerales bacterium]
MTDRPPPPDNILDYAPPAARISRLARIAFYLSLVSVFTFVFILPGLIALILAIIADDRIKKHSTRLTGRNYTYAAGILGACTCLFGFLMLCMPSIGSPRDLADRSSCAANLRGILSSMTIYAAQNSDQFPVVTYAPYSPALNSPTAAATATTANDVIHSYYTAPYPQAGSVTANIWILVPQGISPKLLICKSDPYITGPAQILDPTGRYYDNFQNDKQLSYSFAYPWKADGSVGKWWADTSDASVPVASDMAPQQGTGKPARILNPASTPRNPQTWNSGNHGGDGQNVAFGDVHVDYVKTPTVGHMNDNIWTTSGYTSTGPAEFDGLPAIKASPNLTADKAPYDIIMFPIRNLDTGHL